MKELSIEEKAKRYDEAIERAESIYNETAIPSATTKGICTYIFPELKEGDGEKWIPKEIIKYLKEKGDFRSCWIAWLENQGVHAKFINGIQVGDKVTRSEYGVLVNLSQLNRVAKKQGEHKPTIEMITPEESLGINSDTYNKIVYECIYGEKKHTEKVESNFNVGDWVVYCNDDVDLITGIEENGYCINNSGYIPFICASDIRLWTIQDAKDGDVLAWDDSKCIALFTNI